MITEERVMTLLAESNPVPDVAVFDLSAEPASTHLTDLDMRSREMTDLIPRRPVRTPSMGRQMIMGATAVAAMVVAVVVLLRSTERAPVRAQTSSATTTTVAKTTGQARAGDTITGLTGIAPEGATPSTPENGELVASMWEHIGAPGSFGNGWLYLYTDGRLIWAQADPNPTGGWLERRLTPEGVELIRSEIIATGLFGPNQLPPAPNSGFPRALNGGHVQVRNGEQLVYVNRVVPDLMKRLAELWSWLPEGAWEDTEAKAYVPSRYVVCVHDDDKVAPTDASDIVSMLPDAARDLLASAGRFQLAAMVSIDPAGFAGWGSSAEYCYDIATEEARTLAMILDDARGIEKLPHRWYDGSEVFYLLSKTVAEYNRDPFNTISLAIWPMLPHGVPAFIGA